MLKYAGGVVLLALIANFWHFNVATGGTELAAAGDTLLYYAPQYAAAGASWREGSLPLWNAYQLCGHPWLATLQVVAPGGWRGALAGLLALVRLAMRGHSTRRRPV